MYVNEYKNAKEVAEMIVSNKKDSSYSPYIEFRGWSEALKDQLKKNIQKKNTKYSTHKAQPLIWDNPYTYYNGYANEYDEVSYTPISKVANPSEQVSLYAFLEFLEGDKFLIKQMNELFVVKFKQDIGLEELEEIEYMVRYQYVDEII